MNAMTEEEKRTAKLVAELPEDPKKEQVAVAQANLLKAPIDWARSKNWTRQQWMKAIDRGMDPHKPIDESGFDWFGQYQDEHWTPMIEVRADVP